MAVILKSRKVCLKDSITKLLVVTLVFLLAAVFVWNYIVENKIQDLQNQITSISSLKDKYSYILKNKDKNSADKEVRLNKSYVIKNIIDIPQKMSFDYLIITEKSLEIKGKALSRIEIMNYIKTLKSKQIISRVKLKNINKYDNYRFSLEALIDGTEK
ncbi:MAG: PilN domain-containing protein [Bacillota bacterium]